MNKTAIVEMNNWRIELEIMMNETTLFRRKLTHCFGANCNGTK
jgi:hypothetical protein